MVSEEEEEVVVVLDNNDNDDDNECSGGGRRKIPRPTNSLVTPMLTDLYQITMAYAYWKTNRHEEDAVFELFFRKNPFGGEYTIFCGLNEVLKFLANFKFSESDLEYLRHTPALQHCDPAFFDDYLAQLDGSTITIDALREGSLCYPKMPLLIVSGPLGMAQLLETTLLTLVNFPSLVATNAARMVVAANNNNINNNDDDDGKKSAQQPTTTTTNNNTTNNNKIPKCIEFGLRRAQGVDGGFSASKYCIIGGFDATSNVMAGKLLDISIAGTHAHAFVQSHSCLDDSYNLTLLHKDDTNKQVQLMPLVLKYRQQLGNEYMSTNDGELAAFVAYAVSFPNSFLCLIDTYDTIRSGVRNFLLVTLALYYDCGYVAKGVRLDSGDLSYLSLEVVKLFNDMADQCQLPFLRDLDIVASNDINEDVLHSLNKQGHAMTAFGIGTNLVTCQAQPSLGCVYKLVQINGKPRMKLSQDLVKVLIPGKKMAYRLYGKSGLPLLDLLAMERNNNNDNNDNNDNNINDNEYPQVGQSILCRHPFVGQKRCLVTPTRVEKLHKRVFDKTNGVTIQLPSIHESKQFVKEQIKQMRPDILRPVNPGQYKVSVTQSLFDFLHKLWQDETPIVEIS
jgi:nicotinate phosphoribosyltransferase